LSEPKHDQIETKNASKVERAIFTLQLVTAHNPLRDQSNEARGVRWSHLLPVCDCACVYWHVGAGANRERELEIGSTQQIKLQIASKW
jgi:hypothetical protein